MKWSDLLVSSGGADLVPFDFQGCSLPFSTLPAMPTSAPTRPAGRRGRRPTASWWSTCPGGPCATPSAGSATAAVPTPKASGAPFGRTRGNVHLPNRLLGTCVREPQTCVLLTAVHFHWFYSLEVKKLKPEAESVACFCFLSTERHPISNAIDGTNNWWQSPSIQNGREYHWVTITLDLRQVGKARATAGCLWVAGW